MAREHTNKLLEMVAEGVLDKDTVILALAKYMSDDEVHDCMEINEFLEEDEDEDDEDEDEDEEDEDGEE